jgi:putative aldouronate transport system permease protein
MANRYYRQDWKNTIFDIFLVVFFIVFTFVMLFPFINQLAISFNDGTDAVRRGIYFWPRQFSTDSYRLLFGHQKLLRGALMSVLRVVVGTVTSLFCCGLLGYLVVQRSFGGRRFMRLLFIITLYFSGGLIPLYLVIVALKMTNTFAVYWIPNLINTYYMLIIASYMQNLPDSLAESARMDGATELRIFASIYAPIALPVLAAISIFTAVGHWNSWFDVLIYNPSGKWDTLQVYLRRLLLEIEALAQVQDIDLIRRRMMDVSTETYRAATTMVVTVPIVLVYPFLQRYFISGITIGAVKG